MAPSLEMRHAAAGVRASAGAAGSASSADWTRFGYDAARSSEDTNSTGITAANAASLSPVDRWLALLALYDLVFGLIAYAVFDFLLED